MILLLIPTIIALIVLFLTMLALKKIKLKQNKIGFCIVVINLIIIAIFRFLIPGNSSYGEIIIPFFVNMIINIFLLFMFLNKKTEMSTKSFVSIMIIYLLLMIAIPVYKIDDHEHIYQNEEEIIKEYEYYINFYGIKLYVRDMEPSIDESDYEI